MQYDNLKFLVLFNSNYAVWNVQLSVETCQLSAPSNLFYPSQPLTLLMSSPSLSTICQPEPSHCASLPTQHVGRSTTPAQQSGTRCQMNLQMRTASVVLNGSWKKTTLFSRC